ncbi:MAG TPA: replicative DNA helicase [Negativicutes bacterium]|nr:replicative DNA helicase [Negativicutes bacterium]
MNNRQMPYSVEAEQSILGAMLLDGYTIPKVGEILSSDDFYLPQHRTLYKLIQDINNRGMSANLVTLSARADLEALGGVAYITRLMDMLPSTLNIDQYADIVKSDSTKRRLIKDLGRTVEECYQKDTDIFSIIIKAEKDIYELALSKGGRDIYKASDIAVKTFDMIESACLNNGMVNGVPTGFTDIDRKLAGMQKSDLIFIAARPSIGKTAFVLNIAGNAAIRNGITTALFSLEMSKEQLMQRILCAEALVNSQKARLGELLDEDWNRLARSMGPIMGAPLYMDDTPGIKVSEIRSKCRKLKTERDLGLVIVDYINLVRADKKYESRQLEVGEISRSFKIMAKELDVPIVLLAQLNRGPDMRAEHRPVLSDLRETGSIEQDADVIMFLYRDEYYNPDTTKRNIAEAIIAKQRNGETGTVELVWLNNYTKFMDKERYVSK